MWGHAPEATPGTVGTRVEAKAHDRAAARCHVPLERGADLRSSVAHSPEPHPARRVVVVVGRLGAAERHAAAVVRDREQPLPPRRPFEPQVDRPSLRVGIAHAEAPDRAEALRKMVRATRPAAEIEIVTSLGPVVGAHAGPGTIGFFWYDDVQGAD